MDTRDLTPFNWFRKRHVPAKNEESRGGNVDQDIERFFEDLQGNFGHLPTFLSRFFRDNVNTYMKVIPKIDFSDTEKEYLVEADLPGVKEEDVDITLSQDNVLTLRGKRESQQEQKERNYYRLERSYGSFERTIALPEDGDTEKIEAVFKDGALTVKVPKKERAVAEMKKINLNKV